MKRDVYGTVIPDRQRVECSPTCNRDPLHTGPHRQTRGTTRWYGNGCDTELADVIEWRIDTEGIDTEAVLDMLRRPWSYNDEHADWAEAVEYRHEPSNV